VTDPIPVSAETRPLARAAAAWLGDVAWSFGHSPMVIASSIVLAVDLGAALAAAEPDATGGPVRL
jgi:hypothetical protein